MFDKDGNGSITTNELAAVLKEIGKNVTEKELKVHILIFYMNFNFLYNFFINYLKQLPKSEIMTSLSRKTTIKIRNIAKVNWCKFIIIY